MKTQYVIKIVNRMIIKNDPPNYVRKLRSSPELIDYLNCSSGSFKFDILLLIVPVLNEEFKFAESFVRNNGFSYYVVLYTK